MTTADEAPKQAPLTPPTAHLAQIKATAVSTDETMAMVQFLDGQGQLCILTMDVEMLQTLQHVCNLMRKKVTRRNMPVADISIQPIRTFKVGNATGARGILAFMFDEMMPTEAVYAMHDQDAMKFAEMIESDVLSRMSPEERAAQMKKQHPLLLPTPPRLILPEPR